MDTRRVLRARARPRIKSRSAGNPSAADQSRLSKLILKRCACEKSARESERQAESPYSNVTFSKKYTREKREAKIPEKDTTDVSRTTMYEAVTIARFSCTIDVILEKRKM